MAQAPEFLVPLKWGQIRKAFGVEQGLSNVEHPVSQKEVPGLNVNRDQRKGDQENGEQVVDEYFAVAAFAVVGFE